MGEARARLRLELVVRHVLRRERERFLDVELEGGGALAGDPVQEVERDVVKIGITQMVEGAADVIRPGAALEDLEEVWLEALGTERDTRHPRLTEKLGELRRDRLRGSPRRSPRRPQAAPRAGGEERPRR